MSFGTETIETNKGEFEISVVKLKDSAGVDGTLISEVSQGKDGIKIKLADKMKAMDFLSKHTNLLSDEEKTKLDNEYKKVQIQRLQKEIETLDKDSNANKEPVRIVDDI
jgi:phage terminase small subunit